jgi:hypothetical protein
MSHQIFLAALDSVKFVTASCGEIRAKATISAWGPGCRDSGETGVPSEFTLKLSGQPLTDVTVTVISSNILEGRVEPATLTFTPSNWDTPQTVTVTGIDDADIDGDFNYFINATCSSSDENYQGISTDVPVTNKGNAAAAAIIVTPAQGLQTSESGTSTTFNIRLATKPVKPVQIALSVSDPAEGNPDRTTVTITDENWQQSVTVIVSGVDDELPDGDKPYQISLTAVQPGVAEYAGKTATVSLTNHDDEDRGRACG